MNLTFRGKSRMNISKYPLHHVTLSPAKFYIAMSNGLGGDAFTKNTILDL